MNIQCDVAMYESLRAILTYECIEFSVKHGQDSMTIIVNKRQKKLLTTALNTWYDAIENVLDQV